MEAKPSLRKRICWPRFEPSEVQIERILPLCPERQSVAAAKAVSKARIAMISETLYGEYHSRPSKGFLGQWYPWDPGRGPDWVLTPDTHGRSRQGASAGAGMGNAFLSQIRGVQAGASGSITHKQTAWCQNIWWKLCMFSLWSLHHSSYVWLEAD